VAAAIIKKTRERADNATVNKKQKNIMSECTCDRDGGEQSSSSCSDMSIGDMRTALKFTRALIKSHSNEIIQMQRQITSKSKKIEDRCDALRECTKEVDRLEKAIDRVLKQTK
jgi:glycerol-3-phosphate cytidylyltransferase-like family protein